MQKWLIHYSTYKNYRDYSFVHSNPRQFTGSLRGLAKTPRRLKNYKDYNREKGKCRIMYRGYG